MDAISIGRVPSLTTVGGVKGGRNQGKLISLWQDIKPVSKTKRCLVKAAR